MIEKIIGSIRRNIAFYSEDFNLITNKFNIKDEDGSIQIKELIFTVYRGVIMAKKIDDGEEVLEEALDGEYTLSSPAYIVDNNEEREAFESISIDNYVDTFNFIKGVAIAKEEKWLEGLVVKLKAKPQQIDVHFYINRDLMMSVLDDENRATTPQNRHIHIIAATGYALDEVKERDANQVATIKDLNYINVVFDYPGRTQKTGILAEALMLDYREKEAGLISIFSGIEVEEGFYLNYQRKLGRSFVQNRYLFEIGFSYCQTIDYDKERLKAIFKNKADVVMPELEATQNG